MKLRMVNRLVGNVTIVDCIGMIVHGKETAMLEEAWSKLADDGNKRIAINLRDVSYIDSTGFGRMVRTQVYMNTKGSKVVLFNLRAQRVQSLAQLTRMHTIFTICTDEPVAVRTVCELARAE